MIKQVLLFSASAWIFIFALRTSTAMLRRSVDERPIYVSYSKLETSHRASIRFRAQIRKPFVSVVVVAPSAADWIDRRTRIREQFPRNVKLMTNGTTTVLKFAIGTKNFSENATLAMESEHKKHKDLLLFDCIDMDDDLNWQPNWNLDANISATTAKVMLSIAWAVQQYKFDYFFRLGDDSYFRIDKFATLLETQQIPKEKAVIGQILNTQILGMSQDYPQGMGYGLTYDLCTFIATSMPWLLDTAPEDGVVARWLFAAGAHFINNPNWKSIVDGEMCDSDMVLAHKLPPELWANITSNGSVVCNDADPPVQ